MSRPERGLSLGVALLGAALFGCVDDRPPQGTHAPGSASPSGSARARSAVDWVERSTVYCRSEKDENICRVSGALTPFVTGELRKNRVLTRSTLLLERSTVSKENLARLAELADDITSLRLELAEGKRVELDGLVELKALRRLVVRYWGPRGLEVGTDLAPVARLTNLRRLEVSHAKLRDVRFATPLTALEELSLGTCEIENVDGIVALPKLKELSLGIEENAGERLAPLRRLPSVEELHIRVEGRACDFSWLSDLALLRSLSLAGYRCASAVDAAAFVRAPKLEKLRLKGLTIESLAPIASSTSLRALHLESLGGRNDVGKLAAARGLTTLYFGAISLEDLSMFEPLTQLTRLEIFSQRPLRNPEALGKLKRLERLGLYIYAKESASDLPFLSELPALKELATSASYLTMPGKEALEKKYPRIKFTADLE
jgi:hypothetical protein